MKRQWMAALVMTLCSSSLFAADARFCDQYAKTSIKQQMSNITASCKQKGLRWSTLYAGQNAWCRSVRQSIAENETKVRNDALAKCGAPLSKQVWKSTARTSAEYWLYTEMQAAAKEDDLTAVKFMRSEGVVTSDPAGDNDGGLLYVSVDHQAENVTKFLLSIGKDPRRAVPNGGGSALAAMVRDDKVNYRMLKMLLKNGFDPDSGGEGYSDSYFPVMVAAEKNKYRVMEILLQAGASPNLQRDSTPLMYAIKNRNMGMVKMLAEAGAKVNVSGGMNHCTLPLDAALKSGSMGLVNYLKSKGAKRAECG